MTLIFNLELKISTLVTAALVNCQINFDFSMLSQFLVRDLNETQTDGQPYMACNAARWNDNIK